MRFSIYALLGVAAIASAIPHQNTHVAHEKRDSAPSKWVKRDRIHSRAMLPIRIGLSQSNLDKGHDLLMDV
jgi:tripeptidyl-peptidase I